MTEYTECMMVCAVGHRSYQKIRAYREDMIGQCKCKEHALFYPLPPIPPPSTVVEKRVARKSHG